MKVTDITGQRFGKLTAIERSGSIRTQAAWRCVCDCGNEVVRAGSAMRSGNTESCGCVRRGGEVHELKKKYLSEYWAWAGMKTRCYNKNVVAYPHYGGRGVTVCNEWLNSFPTFLRDVGPRPSPQHSLDRWPDNNGAYWKGNVRWATIAEQNRNQRRNIFIEIGGVRKCVAEWARVYGVAKEGVIQRIARGIDRFDALTTKYNRKDDRYDPIPNAPSRTLYRPEPN